MENTEKKQNDTLRLTADLEGNYLLGENSQDLKAIGVFYAPAGGSVHKIAKRVKHKIAGHKVEMFCVTDISPEKLLDYRTIIMVCSSLGRNTWEREQKDKWSLFLPGLRKVHLNGRKVALIGLGDHVTYPNNFADGMGDLADIVMEIGGVLIGKTLTVDYVFNDSRAIRDGVFVGLPLDEDFESEKTDARIDRWYEMISPELE